MSGRGRKVPPTARIAEFPATAAEQARWWEGHILEVLHGLPLDASEGAVPRPEFDPRRTSLAERERAKATEVTAAGHPVTASGIKQRRQRYQRDGLVGLADGRSAKQMPPFGMVDAAVVEAMRQAIGEAAEDSSKTIGFIVWRAKEILAGQEKAADVEVPSRATLYRLYGKLATGTHATGSARTRRSVNARPPGPFGEVPASAPGELMQIDSTPLDVLVRLDDGIAEKVELTAMVDIATRSITAAVLRPTTKSADASALLARSVTPEVMRPGWSEALLMSRSVLPHRRLLSLDERLEHAAARPVIVPETIVCDHGKVFISNNFLASCRYLGINLQPAHKATPTDKGTIEKTLGSVATLFAQFVAGYTGSTADRPGRKLEDGPLWSLPELQSLLDEWIVAVWQTRPHDGLRDPQAPRRAFSPNEKYATLVESCGYVPVPLNGEDFIELCCPSAGRRSTPTASGSITAPTTTSSWVHCVASIPGWRRRRVCGRSTTTPTTSRGSGYATATAIGGSPCSGSTFAASASRSGSWPGITLASSSQAAPRSRSRTPPLPCCGGPTRAPRWRRALRASVPAASPPGPGPPPPTDRSRPRPPSSPHLPKSRTPSWPRSSRWVCSTRSPTPGGVRDRP